LLTVSSNNERGAAPVEMTFAIILLMLLSLGVMQVAFTLYARNVVAASAHEGARAALERGRTRGEAESIVRQVVTRATGRLIDDLTVKVASGGSPGDRSIVVQVKGVMADFGPVPIPIPLSAIATAHVDEERRR
jgi:Flp pilus assembly protein TadG